MTSYGNRLRYVGKIIHFGPSLTIARQWKSQLLEYTTGRLYKSARTRRTEAIKKKRETSLERLLMIDSSNAGDQKNIQKISKYHNFW